MFAHLINCSFSFQFFHFHFLFHISQLGLLWAQASGYYSVGAISLAHSLTFAHSLCHYTQPLLLLLLQLCLCHCFSFLLCFVQLVVTKVRKKAATTAKVNLLCNQERAHTVAPVLVDRSLSWGELLTLELVNWSCHWSICWSLSALSELLIDFCASDSLHCTHLPDHD